MIFHDDDQLHPQYIEHAYCQLQAIPKANVIVSNARSVPTTPIPDFQKKKIITLWNWIKPISQLPSMSQIKSLSVVPFTEKNPCKSPRFLQFNKPLR